MSWRGKAQFHCLNPAKSVNSQPIVIACEASSASIYAKRAPQSACISVIIPLWRNSAALLPLLRTLRACPEVGEIIVSAAEPLPDLRKQVEALDAIFVETAEPNRGRQLNKGALFATADWLLFQHVDTELTAAHISALAGLDLEDSVGGAFYRKFDQRHPSLRWLEPFERWHSRAFGTIYGDQSIFVRRTDFLRMGGFAPFPLMEDVEFSTRLRRSGRITLLDPPLRSCPKKQIAHGPWRVTLRNLLFLVLFRCGVPVQQLHSWYYSADG
jgi:GT2 family glycosyltransferase